ncbi:MAG: hypothetical protein P1P90_06660 [Patescibacteria group bacterium]|nr:hypothetical protein [Patescibacteria group bacterium]
MNEDESHKWIINLKEVDNLVFGEITSEYRVDENTTNYLAQNDQIEEYDRVERFIKETIITITPDKDIILNTLGSVPYDVEWKRNRFIRFIDLFFVENYEILLLSSIRFLWRIKNPKFIQHHNRLKRYYYRESNRAFLDELKKDGISIIKEDDQAGYYIKLQKNQLLKYLQENLIGSKVDLISIPLNAQDILSEDDLDFLAQLNLSYHQDPKWLSRIQIIMSAHLMIGSYIEDSYFFIAGKKMQPQIIEQLQNIADTNNLQISWE